MSVTFIENAIKATQLLYLYFFFAVFESMDVVFALVLSELMCVVFIETEIKATIQLYTIDLCF